jgi:F-type H+-transporting ATPase subunit b
MDQILNILGSVGFNWHVALANFVNFLIILFILNKFFFRKLGKTITDRQEAIQRGLSQASDAEKALARVEEEKKEILRSAKKEGHAIIGEAEKEAKALADMLREEVEKDIATKMASLEEREAGLSAKVEREFKDTAPILVAQLYAKTLRKQMTEADNNALIESMK